MGIQPPLKSSPTMGIQVPRPCSLKSSPKSSQRSPILGPVGASALARRRGGGEGILRWHSRAISAYTWCVTEKGPQRRWLHKIGEEDSPGCHSQQEEQSGRQCPKLAELRRRVGAGRMAHTPLKKQEEEERGRGSGQGGREVGGRTEKLAEFFYSVYEF